MPPSSAKSPAVPPCASGSAVTLRVRRCGRGRAGREDHERDREPDERVRELESQSDEPCARDNAKADEGVDARVVAVGDERGAVEPVACAKPNLRRELVAEVPDHARTGERPEVGELLGVDQPDDRFVQRDASRKEDREDDRVAGPPFGAGAAEEEGRADRDRGQRIARIVDQIGEERDAPREDEDQHLERGCGAEGGEADEHRAHTRARAHDRAVDESVRMVVPVGMTVVTRDGFHGARAACVDVTGTPAGSVSARVCSWWCLIAASRSATWWSWRR
jgi:hypothetical protein